MKHPIHYICLTSFLLSYLVLPHFPYLTFIVPCHTLFFFSYLHLTLPYLVLLILPCLTYFSYITFILPCFLTFLISPSSYLILPPFSYLTSILPCLSLSYIAIFFFVYLSLFLCLP